MNINTYFNKKVDYDILMQCQKVVDSKTGIVSDCIEMMNEAFDPRLYFYTTLMADTSKYEGHLKCHENNGGAALTRELAMLAAIGESVERYCSSIYDYGDFLYGTYNKLNVNAVHPSQWALFSKEQYQKRNFKFAEFTEDSSVNWVKGYSLTEKCDKYVPATFVHLPYICEPHERIISPCVSTGLAAGTNIYDAILSGIYEAVERDAISIMWLKKLSLPVIDDIRDGCFLDKVYKKYFSMDRSRYALIDITTDIGIPVVFSIKYFKSEKGISCSCGAACRLNSEDAALKGMIEAAQGAKWIQYLHVQDWMWGYNDDFSDITDFQDHIHLYSLPEMVKGLDFVSSSECKKSIGTMPNLSTGNSKEDVNKCVDMLKELGLEVIVVDVTTDDIKETPYNVVKVLIPGLQQLNGDHNFPFLGGERLNSVPLKMGYSVDENVYNDLPHPFP